MDTTTIIASDPKTWVDFAFHVFDKVWPLLAAGLTGAVPGFIAGWLGLNKPGFMKKKETK